jgi:hypothetical protein
MDLNDISEDSHFVAKFPLEPLIDLHNSLLEFRQEINSFYRPFLKILIPPLYFEANISFYKIPWMSKVEEDLG